MKWICLFVFLLTGCYRNHLYVQQEWLDANFLASSKIQTPDPRQKNPPCGQRLLVAWNFPRDLYEEELTLHMTVRFFDNTEQLQEVAIDSRRSQKAFYFPSTEASKRIMTYRLVVTSQEGAVVAVWQHPLWVELIQIGE